MSHNHNCHGDSCSSHHGHHHHHHPCECSHECSNSCCDDHHQSCHHVVQKDFAHQLLEIADEAWMEILKEKIKDQILKTNGPQLEKLAKLVSSSNNERWKYKIAGNAASNHYREKFAEYFNKE